MSAVHLVLSLDRRLLRMRITLRQLRVPNPEVETRNGRLSEADSLRQGCVDELVLDLNYKVSQNAVQTRWKRISFAELYVLINNVDVKLI